MQTVLKRAGGAIPRLFVYLAAAGAMLAVPAYADFGGSMRAKTVTASWYGEQFSGRLTASGSRFDPRGLTAAHRTLPFGTRVRVVNKRNNRSVVVRINDRGPFVKGRVNDLTPAAASALGFSGLTPVALSVDK